MSIVQNLGAQRNEDWVREFRFRSDETTRMDLSGWSFRFAVASKPGLPPLLVLSDAPTAHGSRIVNDGDGAIQFQLRAEDIDALPGLRQAIVSFPYTFRATDAAGIRRVELRGYFIVEPRIGFVSSHLLIDESENFLVTENGDFLRY